MRGGFTLITFRSIGGGARPPGGTPCSWIASTGRNSRNAIRHSDRRLIDAPASSHPMVGDAGSGTYLCSLCRAEMPLDERRAHYRALHRAVFEQQHEVLAR